MKDSLPVNLENWLSPIDLYKDDSLIQSIDLELSRKCNQNCKYCFTNGGEALPNELSLDEIKDVISQAKNIGAKQVVIVGGGEPLLYNSLKELIDFIIGNKLKVLLLTNGTLLDKGKAEYFYSNKVHLCLKLNAFDRAEVHDYLVGRLGSFNKVKENLDMLMDIGYNEYDNLLLGVETVICKQNIKEIPKIWRWAREKNIFPFIELMTPMGRAKNSPELFISQKEAFKIFSELSRIDKNEYNNKWLPFSPIAGAPCRRHYYSCYITSVGEVFPCSGIDLSIGNIREDKLNDILRGSTLINKLRHMNQYVKGKCGKCDFKNQCYGCRGKAFQMNSNPFAEDPFCWYKEEDNFYIDNENSK